MREVWRRRRSADDGFTLVEMLVVMVIMPILAVVIWQTLITVMQSQSRLNARVDSVDQARLAAQEIDRQVRSGNVLYDPSQESLPMSMRIYTQANGAQKCVQWQVDTTNHLLRSRSWDPGWWQGVGTVSSWYTVARDIVNTTAQQPFSLQGPSSSYGSRLMEVDLFVQESSKAGTPVEVTTQIDGRNTQYGYTPDSCSPVPAP